MVHRSKMTEQIRGHESSSLWESRGAAVWDMSSRVCIRAGDLEWLLGRKNESQQVFSRRG